MLELFICIAAIITISLIGYISILHNNHKAEVEELERVIENKNRRIDKYLIKELENEVERLRQHTTEHELKLKESKKEISNFKILMKNTEK